MPILVLKLKKKQKTLDSYFLFSGLQTFDMVNTGKCWKQERLKKKKSIKMRKFYNFIDLVQIVQSKF